MIQLFKGHVKFGVVQYLIFLGDIKDVNICHIAVIFPTAAKPKIIKLKRL